jgi:hypothetical protein
VCGWLSSANAWRGWEQGDISDDVESYDLSWEGAGYEIAFGMNANNTVPVTDGFIRAVDADATAATTWRTNGKVAKVYPGTVIDDASLV